MGQLRVGPKWGKDKLPIQSLPSMISATCQPVRRPFAGSPLRMDGFRAVGGPPTRGPVTARGLLDDQRPDVPPHHLQAPPGATPLRAPLKRVQHGERASPDWPRRALLGLGAGLGAALASALLAQRVRAGASKGKLTADYYKCAARLVCGGWCAHGVC